MLLTIDVGNTQTHLGAFDGEELVEHWRFSTDRQSTGDELAVTIHDLLALRGIGFDRIHGEAVSSVVPRLVTEYRHMFERYLDRDALIVGPGTKTGMRILLENPHELGPDRLVNAVAGWEICQQISRMDVGQSIAILNRDVIAVEALEGTNAMIERAGQLCKVGGWTLIKVANKQQDMRMDVPTIGVTTLEKLHEARAGCGETSTSCRHCYGSDFPSRSLKCSGQFNFA